MGIAEFIASKCVQTAVYWGTPTNDGYGGYTFATPVEINCRWEEKEQVLANQLYGENTATIEVSRAVVYVTQDVDEEGYMWLGSLSGLTTQEKANPKLVEDAFIIKRFEKTPAVGSTTAFLRIAYLTPFLR